MKFCCPELKTKIFTGSTKTSFSRQILPNLGFVIVRSTDVYSILVVPKQLNVTSEYTHKVTPETPPRLPPELCKLLPPLLVFLQNPVAEHAIYLSQETAKPCWWGLAVSAPPASHAGRSTQATREVICLSSSTMLWRACREVHISTSLEKPFIYLYIKRVVWG